MGIISFYPELAKELGSIECAIYYQQLYFWSDKGSRSDGFIYKTKDDLEEETTLSRYQQDKCRDILVNKGWLETKLVKSNGAPTIHYKCRFDIKVLISKKLANGLAKNSLMEKQETRYSITENTTENTTYTGSEFSSKKEDIIEVKEESDTKEKKVKKNTDPLWSTYQKCILMLNKEAGFDIATSRGDLYALKKAMTFLGNEKYVIDLVEESISSGNAEKSKFSLPFILSAPAMNKYKLENI